MASSLGGYPPSHGRTAAADDVVGCAGCLVGDFPGSVLEGVRWLIDAASAAGSSRSAAAARRAYRRRFTASPAPGLRCPAPAFAWRRQPPQAADRTQVAPTKGDEVQLSSCRLEFCQRRLPRRRFALCDRRDPVVLLVARINSRRDSGA